MDRSTRDRVLSMNPWLLDPSMLGVVGTRHTPQDFVPRQIDVAGFDDPARAKLVVGPRQAGKSTFVWSLLRDKEPATLLFLNCEEPLVQLWARSSSAVLADLRAEFPAVTTVFLEEAQQLDEPGLLIKGLVDAHVGLNVFVTGSSAFHLDAKTRESLAGRAIRRRLLPFSLEEVSAHRPPSVPAAASQRRERLLGRQLVFGGFPGPWFADNPPSELAELVEAFVLRDASDRFEVREVEAFRRMLQLAAGQVGQMVNLSEWGSLLGVSATTVSAWLELLEGAWILKRVPPFAGGKRREITGARRVHFFDVGVRNALLGAMQVDVESRQDRGVLAEAWVFGELSKLIPAQWGLFYWRAKGGAEMDFVLVHGDRRIGVEVKAGRRVRISRSTRSFIDAYGPELVCLVGGIDVELRRERIGKTEVVTLPMTLLGAEVLARATAQNIRHP